MKIDISLPEDNKPVLVELEEKYVNGFCAYMAIDLLQLSIILGHIIRPVVEEIIRKEVQP